MARHHTVCDRAVVEPLAGHVQQFHKAVDGLMPNDSYEAGPPALLELMPWATNAGCCAHDAHGALGRSLQVFLEDSEVTTSTWVVLESCRNTLHVLANAAPAWLPTALVFQGWDFCEEDEYWKLLGVPADVPPS